MYSKNLHSGHRERMRKRFLASGQDGLFEHELLELLLFYARPIVNTTGIAHALIEELGSFGKVLSSDTDKLKSIKGVGEGGAEFLRFMSDMGRAYLRSSHTSEALTTAEQLCACLSELSSENGKRVCTLLCLSHASELLRTIYFAGILSRRRPPLSFLPAERLPYALEFPTAEVCLSPTAAITPQPVSSERYFLQ